MQLRFSPLPGASVLLSSVSRGPIGLQGPDGTAIFATAIEFAAATISDEPDFVITMGYREVGVGGNIYKRSLTEPSHAGKIQSVDGAWWEATSQPTFTNFAGAVHDGTANATTEIQSAMDYCAANGIALKGPSGTFRLDSALRIPSGLTLEMDADCILLRNYTQTGTTGLLMNPDMLVKIQNVIIRGGSPKTPTTPDAGQTRVTTATFSLGGNTMVVASPTGVLPGFKATGTGIVAGSIVSQVSGSNISVIGPAYTPVSGQFTADVTDGGVTFTNPFAGNQFCLNGDNILIEDVFLDEWSGTSRAFLCSGDKNRIRRVRAVSAGLGGGIRVIGGDQWAVTDCYVESGDDCYNFVPGGTGSLLFDLSITNSYYANCEGKSHFARLFIAALSGSGGSGSMTASIKNIGFHNIRGYASNRAFTVYNEDSSGVIRDVDITDCSIDTTNDVTSGNAAFLQGAAGSGGVYEVRMNNLTMPSPHAEAFDISGVIDGIYLDGFSIGPSRTSGSRVFDIKDITRGAIKNGAMQLNGAVGGIVLGASALTVRGLLVENVKFTEIENGQGGVHVIAGVGIDVRKCQFFEKSGQTTARGVRLDTGVTDCVVERNDAAALTVFTKYIDVDGVNTLRDNY